MLEPISERKHILVVEDDQAIDEMIRMLLEIEGYRVTSVALGNQALDMLIAAGVKQARDAVDLILLDLQLPDMDGAGIVPVLEQVGQQIPPVIVLSARPKLAVEQTAAEIHAVSFLSKPFNITDLLQQIERALAGSALASQ